MGITSPESRKKNEFFSAVDFDRLDEHEDKLHFEVSRQERSFFGAARIATQPEQLRFGLFKRIFFGLKTGDKDVDELYREWTARKPSDNMTRGEEFGALPNRRIEELVIERDPAIIVVSSLEHIRTAKYPDISIEGQVRTGTPDRLTALYDTYEKLISSIHSKQSVSH